MQSVNPIVFRYRWLLWVPWLAAMFFWVDWLYSAGRWNYVSWFEMYQIYFTGFGTWQSGLEGFFGFDMDDWMPPSVYLGVAVLLAFAFLYGSGRPATRRSPLAMAVTTFLMASLTIAWFVFLSIPLIPRDFGLYGPRPWEVFLLIYLVACVLALGIGGGLTWRMHRGHEVYWRLESTTRWLAVGALAVTGTYLLASSAGYGNWRVPRGWGAYDAWVIGVTVLLWSWACRVILLHRLRAWEKANVGSACFACEYDLRGTLASKGEACPECGMAVSDELRRRYEAGELDAALGAGDTA